MWEGLMDQIELSDPGSGGQAEEACLPVSIDTGLETAKAAGIEEPSTAVEAVRYLLLARELRRLGQEAAAERWQSPANAWLERFSNASDT